MEKLFEKMMDNNIHIDIIKFTMPDYDTSICVVKEKS